MFESGELQKSYKKELKLYEIYSIPLGKDIVNLRWLKLFLLKR